MRKSKERKEGGKDDEEENEEVKEKKGERRKENRQRELESEKKGERKKTLCGIVKNILNCLKKSIFLVSQCKSYHVQNNFSATSSFVQQKNERERTRIAMVELRQCCTFPLFLSLPVLFHVFFLE